MEADNIFVISVAKEIFLKAIEAAPAIMELESGKDNFQELGKKFNALLKELDQGIKALKS